MSQPRQSRRKKQRKGTFIDKTLQNEAGFYEGMPGCTVDQNGNRMMISFVLTPKAVSTSMIYAHPLQITQAIAEAGSNKMVKEIVISAASRILRDSKKRQFLGFRWLIKSVRQTAQMKKMHKIIEAQKEQIEQLTITATEKN